MDSLVAIFAEVTGIIFTVDYSWVLAVLTFNGIRIFQVIQLLQLELSNVSWLDSKQVVRSGRNSMAYLVLEWR